jgi:hypothetical protein
MLACTEGSEKIQKKGEEENITAYALGIGLQIGEKTIRSQNKNSINP